jgi:hypothetical protein
MTAINDYNTVQKLSIVCPLFNNDGLALDGVVDTIAAHIARVSGGVSQYKQVGMWFNDSGTKYIDESIVLYTYCDKEQLETLERYFTAWSKQLEQICLLVSVEPAKVAFIPGIVEQVAA